MTDHLQQAIEEAKLTANLNAARVFFKLSPEMTRLIQQVVEETVEIAVPHIRVMIAEEIREAKEPGKVSGRIHDGTLENATLEKAAQIAEGGAQNV